MSYVVCTATLALALTTTLTLALDLILTLTTTLTLYYYHRLLTTALGSWNPCLHHGAAARRGA